jgi:hypothetical protein
MELNFPQRFQLVMEKMECLDDSPLKLDADHFAKKDSKEKDGLETHQKNQKNNSKKCPCHNLYENDQNFLFASWIDDIGYPQKEFEDKITFFNSESILNRENFLSHFSFQADIKKLLNEKNIQYACKKGKKNPINQDSFFCISEGINKIYGVFDGHGLNGHLISSYTMGAMAEYIQNSKRFKDIRINDFKETDDG